MPHHHQTNSQNNLTFLKSNYKFKRRNMRTMRALPVATAEARRPNQLAATLSKTSAATAAAAATSHSHQCSTVLSLFIVIAWNIVQDEDDDRATDHGHDVNAAPVRHSRIAATAAAAAANDEVSTAREQQQQHLSSSSPGTRATSVQLQSGRPLMTLLIGLLLLNMRPSAAGTCWQTHLGNGKCNQIFSTNITKSECCGASQTFSYTDRELSSVEYFFAQAIGGGVECAPCTENCKSFKCGPNKKCVKRKGRPKCVCAPECGALRRKQQQHQKQQQQQQLARSLSSEITNINLGLDGAKRQRKHSDNNSADNQRKQHPPTQEKTQPQRHSHKKAQGETKHRKLLILDTSNLPEQQQQQPTTRRSSGRVEMTGYERRRHRNNHGKHLTRSMTTGANDSSIATTPAQTTIQSRHKLANANEPANDTNRRQQQQQDNARVRHHQHAPNHDNGQEQQRRRKHKHNKDPQQRIQVSEAEAEVGTTAATTTSLTANTTMSGARRRLYQAEHGSEMAASSGSHDHLANVDDLAFLGGIYEPVVMQQQQQQQQHTNPVCGTDGRTYNTECQLRKRACRSNNAQLEVAYRGHCKTSCHGVQCLKGLNCVEDQYMMPHCIPCKIECPRQEELDVDNVGDDIEERAVCGVDGQTYRSTCDINRMICQIGRSIAVAYPGPCRADRVSCADIKCGPKDKCLVDLQTHMPRCVSCSYKCPRKQQRMPFQVDKICGFNNHTYNSWCEMRKDSCATGYFIGIKSTGHC